MTLLLDGDIILYRIAFAVQASQGDYLDLREAIHEEVERWGSIDPEADIVVCLSDHSGDPAKRSFRYGVYPEYKKHRQDTDKPLRFEEAAAILRSDFYTAELAGLEADDIMGILQTDKTCIVTIDKDLEQVPGQHWNPDKDSEIREVSWEQGVYQMHLQWLMGDATDGYGGIPKVGPKKAEKALAPFWSENKKGYAHVLAELAIKELYAAKGLTPEYCQQMRLCAEILQTTDQPVRVV